MNKLQRITLNTLLLGAVAITPVSCNFNKDEAIIVQVTEAKALTTWYGADCYIDTKKGEEKQLIICNAPTDSIFYSTIHVGDSIKLNPEHTQFLSDIEVVYINPKPVLSTEDQQTSQSYDMNELNTKPNIRNHIDMSKGIFLKLNSEPERQIIKSRVIKREITEDKLKSEYPYTGYVESQKGDKNYTSIMPIYNAANFNSEIQVGDSIILINPKLNGYNYVERFHRHNLDYSNY